MEEMYKGIDRVHQNNSMKLKRKFELVTTKKSESMESNFSRLLDIEKKMEFNQYELLVRTFVEKALNTLPMKFDHMVVVIQEIKFGEFDYSKFVGVINST